MKHSNERIAELNYKNVECARRLICLESVLEILETEGNMFVSDTLARWISHCARSMFYSWVQGLKVKSQSFIIRLSVPGQKAKSAFSQNNVMSTTYHLLNGLYPYFDRPSSYLPDLKYDHQANDVKLIREEQLQWQDRHSKLKRAGPGGELIQQWLVSHLVAPGTQKILKLIRSCLEYELRVSLQNFLNFFSKYKANQYV